MAALPTLLLMLILFSLAGISNIPHSNTLVPHFAAEDKLLSKYMRNSDFFFLMLMINGYM